MASTCTSVHVSAGKVMFRLMRIFSPKDVSTRMCSRVDDDRYAPTSDRNSTAVTIHPHSDTAPPLCVWTVNSASTFSLANRSSRFAAVTMRARCDTLGLGAEAAEASNSPSGARRRIDMARGGFVGGLTRLAL